MIVVFDLDSTLADGTHRLWYKDDGTRDWDGFFAACHMDTPIEEIIEVCNALYAAGYTIEIWSGRSDIVRDKTIKWLKDNGVQYHSLRMRKAGDHRNDQDLKETWLHELDPRKWPDLVFEDRKRVVDMWRRNNIRCCQVESGEF